MQENVSFKGSPCPNSTTSAFCSAAKGRRIEHAVACGLFERRLEAVEEAVRGVGNGLPAKVARASWPIPCIPHHSTGLMHSSGVAARQVDGLIGAFGVGRIPAVDAPMVAVQIVQRQIEDHQFLELRGGHGPQKRPQGRQLLPFPNQPAANIERLHAVALPQEVRDQNAAIQSALASTPIIVPGE